MLICKYFLKSIKWFWWTDHGPAIAKRTFWLTNHSQCRGFSSKCYDDAQTRSVDMLNNSFQNCMDYKEGYLYIWQIHCWFSNRYSCSSLVFYRSSIQYESTEEFAACSIEHIPTYTLKSTAKCSWECSVLWPSLIFITSFIYFVIGSSLISM